MAAAQPRRARTSARSGAQGDERPGKSRTGKSGAGKNTDRWVWIDCEMTGLDPDRHVLLEIATIITDTRLTVVATGP